MTTVVDPNGTPVPVYNRSGTTIQNIAANDNTNPAVPYDVSLVSEITVLVVSTTRNPANGNGILRFDASADPGSYVEIYNTDDNVTFDLKDSNNSYILTLNGGAFSLGAQTTAILRKISSSTWAVLK